MRGNEEAATVYRMPRYSEERASSPKWLEMKKGKNKNGILTANPAQSQEEVIEAWPKPTG